MLTANAPTILITGGTGYIGTHIAAHLPIEYNLVLADNLCNSTTAPLDALYNLTGRRYPFENADVREEKDLERIFSRYKIDCVVHCAGLKSLADSNTDPLSYYSNNVAATVTLLSTMKKYRVSKIVFSSSATVYGQPKRLPLDEEAETGCTNPYGRTKLFTEHLLKDLYRSAPDFWNVAILRYFNPIGAHASGLIGEDATVELPNNLMPYVAKVAVGTLPILKVFGGDWNTPDGTGVRDYIHISDLAEGHVAAISKLLDSPNGLLTLNLGTGVGYSVLQMIEAFQKTSGKRIAYEIVDRRLGDCATVYADPSAAEKILGWSAKRGLAEMCDDLWRWQSKGRDMSREKEHGKLRSMDSGIALEVEADTGLAS